jgi:hypothetical protein
MVRTKHVLLFLLFLACVQSSRAVSSFSSLRVRGGGVFAAMIDGAVVMIWLFSSPRFAFARHSIFRFLHSSFLRLSPLPNSRERVVRLSQFDLALVFVFMSAHTTHTRTGSFMPLSGRRMRCGVHWSQNICPV